ncbi:Alpha/Beta hydrolase protein [Xylariaceae sp. FL0016]|nr:Alpha/Beta hydrolase protein [Xylariaceae sp. FL0016]
MMHSYLGLLAFFAVGITALSSPRSIASGITLLINNDLQGAESPFAKSGVLLLEDKPKDDAVNSCRALGEELWSSNGTANSSSSSTLQPLLDYLVYTGVAENSTRFWIKTTGLSSQTMGIDGGLATTNASLAFPVLCTQTAPLSNATYQDTSATRRITVHSNGEYLTGYRDGLSFRFLGVRYAPQPRRFTYSKPYAGNGSQVSALDYGSQCAQAGNVGSEDCLFMNIWSTYLPGPSSQNETLKPVMFWIHGGAFTGGTANDVSFDGGNLASRGDVVVVAINYRLANLGFLALNDGITNGNYGLADQINALDWVRKNIKDFGGDPDKITVFGQSAGAGSVRAMMASPGAVGKFAGAIPVSNLGGINYGTTYSKYLTIEEQLETAGNAVLSQTDCASATSQVDCLRALPASTLASLGAQARYLVVDGKYLTSDELQLEGPAVPYHLMMGTTRDDGAPFITYPTTTNESAYLMSQGFQTPPADLFPIPDIANQTLALFNMSTRLATDGIFRCIDQATAYAGLQNGRFSSVYFYEFNRTYQTSGWPGLDVCEPPKTASHPNGDPSGEYFKCHSGEIYYIFGNLARQGLPMRDDLDLPFEQLVLDTFASFARTFDPNPDPALLAARRYTSTAEELEGSGRWLASLKDEMTLRTLQWPSFQGPFNELEQCKALDLGLDYYVKAQG